MVGLGRQFIPLRCGFQVLLDDAPGMRRFNYDGRMSKAQVFRLPILLVLVITAIGCAGGWTEMKTKRFTGHAFQPRDHREHMEQLELAHATLATFFPKADIGPVEVVFLDDNDFLFAYGTDRFGLALPKVPGGGRLGAGNVLILPTNLGYPVVTVMLTHLFLNKVVPNAPLWLHEGMAMYFSKSKIGSADGKWVACFGANASIEGSAEIIRLPLDKFFAIGWKDFASSNPQYYRGTGVLLIDFLFHGDKGVYLEKLPSVLAAVAQGTPGPQIMAATFPGMNLEQLGQRIYDFKASGGEQRERGQICPLPIPVAADKLPDEASPQEKPDNVAEVEQLLEAVKKLPQGDRLPSWYPPEIVGG
jgi:hypothetical protein